MPIEEAINFYCSTQGSTNKQNWTQTLYNDSYRANFRSV